MLFVCDVVSYGDAKRTDIVQAYIRENLYELLEASFEHALIPFSGVYKEDRGDGVLVAAPAEHDPAALVTVAVERLRADLGRYNSLSSEAARIALRVAVHIGIAKADAHGLIGTEVNHVFRLLEAPLFKAMVKDGGATIGLIVSQRFHDEVVLRDTGLISAEDYLRVPVSVKETDCSGWVRIFGGAAPAVLRTAELEPRPETRLAPSEAVAPSVISGLEPEPESAFDEPEIGLPGLFELVECALRIPGLLTERGRDQVVEVLPSSIAVVIPRSHDARSDVYQILRTCLDYPEGLQYFVQAIKAFFGGSMAVARLERMVAQVLARF
ncbi:effector-associated domain 2-containing protein [Actinocorallia aurantiaca]|uniref:Effector-associated domain-containing protein n=1 Tax=Actinocorallia aurantiaca TaxID=46204 RepID=A0ABN3UCU5_9ACTN